MARTGSAGESATAGMGEAAKAGAGPGGLHCNSKVAVSTGVCASVVSTRDHLWIERQTAAGVELGDGTTWMGTSEPTTL